MALKDHLLIEDADLARHEQPEIPDDVVRKLVIAKVIAMNVETKPLSLIPPPLEKSISKSNCTRLW